MDCYRFLLTTFNWVRSSIIKCYKADSATPILHHNFNCEHQPDMPGPSENKVQHKYVDHFTIFYRCITNMFCRQFQRLFALVIGIDRYKNVNGEDLCNLNGAVADANAVYNFLRNDLGVPATNVRNLRDSEATRENIIEAIQSFVFNVNIEKNDPIFIYYAGHGATSKAKISISNDSTPFRGQEFEVIVPSDINLASDYIPNPRNRVTGIADYEIRRLLNEVAKKKGNNIVRCSRSMFVFQCRLLIFKAMLLDCCHSASLDRGDKESGNIRQMSNPSPLEVDVLDLSRDCGFVPGSAGLDSESHVLLAACGKGEKAMERDGHGLFTTAILRSLSKFPIQTFSYRSLLDSLQLER